MSSSVTPSQEGGNLGTGSSDSNPLDFDVGSSLELDKIAQEQDARVTDAAQAQHHLRYRRLIASGFVMVSLIAVGLITIHSHAKDQNLANHNAANISQQLKIQSVPLSNLSDELSSKNTEQSPALAVNGSLTVNSSLQLVPSTKPNNPVAGQIYYDQTSGKLAYYNGSQFVYLQETPPKITTTSVGGAQGTITLAAGLAQNAGVLSNDGVLSLQGKTGNVSFSAGNGIAVNGTTFANSGVLSLGGANGAIRLGDGLKVSNGSLSNIGVISVVSDSPNLTVTNNNGAVSISSVGSGTGSVSSSGGTIGHIAEFTGAQDIEDSLLTQSGTTVSLNGTLSATDLSGNGSAVTNVNAITLQGNTASFYTNAGNISSGTLADGRLSANVTLQGNTFNVADKLVQLNGTAGLPALDGSLLTSLNATNISSGTLNDSRLSSNVALLNATTNNFTGTNLEHSGNAVCDASNNCNYASSSGSGNYIQNQSSSAQSANYYIRSAATNKVGAVVEGANGQTADLLDINTYNGTSSTTVGKFDSSGNLSVTGTTQTGNLTVNNSGTITLNNLTGGASTCLTLNGSNQVGTATCSTGSGSTPTLQDVYNNSGSSPDIALNSTGKGVVIQDASSPVGGNLFAVQDNAGSNVYLAVTTSGVNVAGTLSATSLQGDGSAVTNVNAVTLNGNASSYFTNATNISSGTLNDSRLSSNVALLNATTNNFTGTNLEHSGNAVCDASNNCNYASSSGSGNYIQNQSSSAQSANYYIRSAATNKVGAVVEGANGQTADLLDINTYNGTSSTTVGKFDSSGNLSVTGTTQTGNLTVNNSGTITLNNLTGGASTCLTLNGSNQVGTATCSTGSGSTPTLQDVYNNSGSSPDIALNSTGKGVVIQDASSPVGGNLFAVQDNAGSNVYLAVTTSGVNVAGTLSATSLQGDGSAVTNVNAVTLNGNASSYFTNATNISSGTLNDSRLSSNVALLNATTNNFTGTNLEHSGNAVCDASNNCNYASSSGSGNYIQNQSSSAQSANYYIRSAATNKVGAVVEGANGQTADLLDINTYNGTSSTTVGKFDSSGNLSVTGTTQTGNLTVNNSGTITLNNLTGGASTCLTLNGSNQVGTATCSTGSGSTPTLQDVYNNSGSSPDIALNSTGKGVVIQDASSPVGGNLFAVQDNAGSNVYLAVTTSGVNVAGTLSATSLQGDGSAVTNVNAVTLNGNASSYFTNATNISSGTLNDSRLSSNVALLNATTNNFTGTNLEHSGNAVCDASNNCNYASSSGSGNYIQNQSSSAQSANYYIRSAATNKVGAVVEGANGQTADLLDINTYNGTSSTTVGKFDSLGNAAVGMVSGTTLTVGQNNVPNAKLNVNTGSTVAFRAYQAGTYDVGQFAETGTGVGTVTTNGTTTVTGSSTQFTQYFQVGDVIQIGSVLATVTAISSDTSLTTSVSFGSASGQTYYRGVVGAGTVTTYGTTAIVGSGTSFTTTFQPGDSIMINGESNIGTIASITDNTHLTLYSAAATSASGLSYARYGYDRLDIKANGNVGIGTNNSSAALMIQPTGVGQTGLLVEGANGQTADLLDINTYNGTSSTTVGKFDSSGNLSVTGTTQTGNLTVNNSGTITLNNLTGGASTCLTLNGSNQVGTATCSTGSGSTPTLQDVYNNSGSSPDIALNSTGKGVVIQDASSPVGGNLFAVQDNAGSNVYLAVTTSGVNVAGTLSATSLQGDGSAVTNVNAVTLNGNASSYFTNATNISSGTLNDSRLSSNVALLNATTNNFTGTNLEHSGNAVCDASNNCNYASSSGSGNYIQNQSSSAQSANYYIRSAATNKVGAVVEGANGQTADLLDINTYNGTSSTTVGKFDSSGNLSVTGTTQTGNLTVNNSGTITLNNLTGGASTCLTLNGSNQVGTATCSTGSGSTPTLQDVYNNSGSSPDIALNSTGKGVVIQDASSPVGGNLFAVQDNAGSNVYLAVTTSGVNVAGTLSATSLQGDGSAVTNVNAVTLNGNASSYFTNATNISSGTLNDSRLSSNVALLNATTNNFTGTNLEHSGNAVCDASNNCNYASSSGSGNYIQNQSSSAQSANYYIRSAATNKVGAVVEGANGQTADLLDINTYNGTSSTTVGKFDSLGNAAVGMVSGTTLTVGQNNVPNAKLNVNTGSTVAFRAYQAGTYDVGQFAETGTGVGTVTTNATVNVVGSSTQFTQYFQVGDVIQIGSVLATVTAISSDTSLTTSVSFGSASGQTYYRGVVGAGTVTTYGTTAIVGSGTSFTTTFQPGDSIMINGESNIGTIASITDNTHLTLYSAAATSASGLSYARYGYDRLDIKANGNVGIGTNNSSAALMIQPTGVGQTGLLVEGANGQTADLLDINTYNGTSSTTVGKFDSSGNLSVTGTTQTGNLTVNNSGTITLNNLTGGASTCLTLNGSNQVGTATCSTGSGSTPTLQDVYNNSGSSPDIALNSTGKGVVIQDASSPVGGNLFAVQDNAGSNVYLAVTTSGVNVAGTLSATSLQGDGSAVTNVNAVTLNGNASSYFTNATNISSGTLNDSRLSSNVALLNATTNNFTGTNLEHSGNAVCDASNNCNYASSSGSGNYIQNQSSSAQSANYYIRSAATNKVGAVVEGANGQTADLLDINTYNGTSSTTVGKFDSLGNAAVGMVSGTTLTVGQNNVPNAKLNVNTGSTVAFRAYQAGTYDVGQFAETGTGVGTVTTNATVNVVGSSTQFTQYFQVGDVIQIGSVLATVTAISSDTSLTTSVSFGSASGQTYYRGVVGAGTVTTYGTTAIVGSGTSFTTTFQPGDSIMINGESNIGTIASITDNTHLTLYSAAATSASGLSYARYGYDRLDIKANGNVGIGTNNSSAALMIQPTGVGQTGLLVEGANGQTADLLDINTYNGTSSTTVGKFDSSGNLSVTGTTQTGNLTVNNSGTITLNNLTGGASTCLTLNGSNQVGTATCSTGSGSTPTLQDVYNNSGSSPDIALNSTGKGVVIQDASSPVGGNLFAVQDNAGSNVYLAVTTSGVNVAGTLSATSLQGDGSAVTNVNAVTLNGNASSYFTNATNISSGTLNDSRLSSNVALLNATTNNFTGTNLEHSGNAVCDASNNCNYASSSGSGNYIQNQSSSAQSANYYIRSAATNKVGAVVEGANGQTADLLDINTYNGTSSTTVGKFDSLGNAAVGMVSGTTLTVGQNNVPNAKLNVNTGSTVAFRAYQAGTYDVGQFAETGTGVGTVTTNATVNVVGSSTQFTQYFQVGDAIQIGSQLRTISSITDDTHLAVGVAFTSSASGQTYYRGVVGAGTVTTNGTAAIVGSGTSFTTTFQVGDSIMINGESNIGTIASITDNTHLTLYSAAATSASGLAYARYGYDRLDIKANGNVGIGTNNSSAALMIQPTGVGQTGLLLQAANGQTATLMNVQDSSSNSLLGITANGSGSDTVNVGYNGSSAVNSTVNIGNATNGSGSTQAVNIGSTSSASATNIYAGTGNILLETVNSSGGTVVKSQTNNSTAAFQVQNASGASQFNVNTANVLINDNMVSNSPTGTFVRGAYWVSGQYVELNNNLSSNGDGEVNYSLSNVGNDYDASFDFWSHSGDGDGTFFYSNETQVPDSYLYDAQYGGYEIAFDDTSSEVQLYYNGGLIDSAAISAPNNGAWHTAEIIKTGDTFTVKYDGNVVLTYTDATRTLTGTNFGIGGCSCAINGEHRAKDFVLTSDQINTDAYLQDDSGLDVSGVATVDGQLEVLPGVDSTSALQVEDASGASVLNVDTANQAVTTDNLNIGPAINVGGAGRLFSDGFESGNFNLWDYGATDYGFNESGSSTISVDASPVHDGKFAAKVDETGSGDAFTSTPIGSTTAIDSRMYVDVSSIGSTGVVLEYNMDTPDTNEQDLYLDSSGHLCWNGDCSSAVLNTNTWYEVEIDATIDPSSGSVNVYLDGTNVISQTGIDTGSNPMTQFYIGDGNSGDVGAYSVDDVSIDTVRPGDSSNLNVNDSLHVAGTSSFGNQVLVQSANNSTTAFQVQDASSDTILDVDTSSNTVNVGYNGSSAVNATVNIGNASNGNQTVTVGSTSGSSTTNIQSGTGGLNLNNNVNNDTNINTGSSTGSVNIGNGSAGAVGVTSGSSITNTVGNTVQTITNGGETIQNNDWSENALEVQDANSKTMFQVDTNDWQADVGYTSLTSGNGPASGVTLDVGGAVQQQGMLTDGTGSSDAGYWAELGYCDIQTQYDDCDTTINVLGGYDGGDEAADQATISARVKQQPAMGSLPYVDVTVNGVAEGINASNIAAVVTTNNGSDTIVELWGQINNNYEQWAYAPGINNQQYSSYAGWQWTPTTALQASLPTGVAGGTFYAQYGDTFANTMWVQPASGTDTALDVYDSGSSIDVLKVSTNNDCVGIDGSCGGAGEALTLNTGNDDYGWMQTDGTVALGSALDDTNGGAVGTYTDNNFGLFTNNNSADAETIYTDGTAMFQNYSDSSSGFQVQDHGGDSILNVDTSAASVQIGDNAANVDGETLTVQQATGAYGMMDTDGTTSLGTYIGSTWASLGTYSNTELNLFTGNNAAAQTIYQDGSAQFKDYTDNNQAFSVLQNSSGDQVFAVDTTNGQAILGDSTNMNGQVAFEDSGDSNTITLGTNSSDSLNLTVPGGSGADNFGYSDIDAASDDSYDTSLYSCSLYTANMNGTVNSITVEYDNVNYGDLAQAAIYTNSSGNPGSRLAYSDSVTLAYVGGPDTFPLTHGSASVTAGTSYWLCTGSNGSNPDMDVLAYSSNGTTNQSKAYTMGTYGTWPGSLSSPSYTSNDQYVISANYSITGSTTTSMSISKTGAVTLQNAADSTSAFSVQDSSSNQLFNVDSTDKSVNVANAYLNVNGLPDPQPPTLTTSSSGGSLGSGYYTYAIDAVDAYGNTTGVVTAQTSSGLQDEHITSGSSNKNTLTWATVTSAASYDIWRCEASSTVCVTDPNSGTWYHVSVSSGTTTFSDTTNSTWSSSNQGDPNLSGDNTTTGINLASGSQINLDGGPSGQDNVTIGVQPGVTPGQEGETDLNIGNYYNGGGVNILGDSFNYDDTTSWTEDFGVDGTGAMVRSGNTNATDAFIVYDSNWDTALEVNTNNVTQSASGTAAILKLGKNSSDNDSIVAAGAILSNQGDYAEYFTQSTPDSLQPGDVVCLNASGSVEDCGKNSSDTLLGVVSTSPGYVGNNALADSEGTDNTALVSMLGQVPVKVSGTNGPIHVGDMLSYDPVTGLAVKATAPGMTIGSALEDFSGGTGEINIYIHIGYYDPTTSNGSYIQDGGAASLSSLNVSGDTTLANLTVTGNATFSTLTVQTLTVGHIVTQGITPNASTGNMAGSGADISVTGTDTSGKIVITTGSDTNSGDLADLTFAKAYSGAPNVVLTAGDANAAKLQQFVSPSVSGFSINAATTNGLLDNQTYTFYYHVMQ